MNRSVLLAGTLGLLALACNKGDDPRLDAPRDVEDCIENMRQIYRGMVEHKNQSGSAPEGSGVALFARLIPLGIWEDTSESRARLTCPGPGAHAQEGDFGDAAALSARHSAYAGRNTVDFPLAKFPAGGPEQTLILACDNAGGMNHEGITNALYSDGTVKTFVLEQLRERGTLPAGTETLVVGPDSPLEELRVLSPD